MDDEFDRSVNWTAIIIILFLLILLVLGCSGIGAYVYVNRETTQDIDPEHAEYLSKVCNAIAGRLETSFGEIDTRQEALDLYGIVGDYAIAGTEVNVYEDLPKTFEDAAREALGDDKPGPLSDDDKERVIQSWKDLADAFN